MPTIAPVSGNATDWRKKLARSGVEGFRVMRKFAQKRRMFVREFVGSHYGGLVPDSEGDNSSPSSRRRPFNTLNQGVNVLIPNVVARNPGVRVKPRKQVLKGSATILGRLCEHANEQEDHVNALRWLVLDAMFTAGIAYTHLEPSGWGILEGTEFRDLGKLVTTVIDLDDFAVDPTAKRWGAHTWAAHTLRVRRDEALEKGMYSPDFIAACRSYEEPAGTSPLLEDLTKGGMNRDEANQYTDYIYVTQYFLPRERVFVTMPGVRDERDFDTEHVEERAYFGPEDGCYDMLGFGYAPSQLMPIAPVGMWIDLHLAINTVARKLVDQIKVMKSVIAGDMGAEDDMLALDAALHTGMVRVKNIDRIKQLAWGQPTETGMMIFERLMEYCSKNQMNTDLLGGLQSSGGTATEAEIVSAGANVRVTDMQDTVYKFEESIQKKRAWHLFHDPLIQETLTFELSPQMSIQLPVDNEMLEGDFLEYNFSIKAMSMQRVDPQLALRRKLDHLPAIGQALQLEAGSGFRFNADGWIRNTGQDIYAPGEIDEFWRSPESAMEAAQVFGQFAPMLPQMAPPGAQQGPAAIQSPGGNPMTNKPGLPGRPGMPGRTQTGAASPNFDRSQNTMKTVSSV